MTQSEQKEFDELREQLASAQAGSQEIKTSFVGAIDRLKNELRLYRGLFWCMLAFATIAGILRLLQR